MKARPTFNKRNREKARAERKREKAERREQRASEKEQRKDENDGGVDPDIAGIVPGPQKLDVELFGAESLVEDVDDTDIPLR